MIYRLYSGIILSSMAALHGATTPRATTPQPYRAVNLSREQNACYSASMLQALIALKPWRDFIFKYPPQSSCVYDKNLLKELQIFIRNYAAISQDQKPSIKFTDFYNTCRKKEIITHQNFDDPSKFFGMLNKILTKDEQCYLNRPFTFEIKWITSIYRHRPDTELKSSEAENFIAMLEYQPDKQYRRLVPTTSVPQKKQKPMTNIVIPAGYLGYHVPLYESLKSTLDGMTTTKLETYTLTTIESRRFTSLPDILWIRFDQPTLLNRDYSVSISSNLDLARWYSNNDEQNTMYQLVSIIWRSQVHYIAYVRYFDTWYQCDDTQSTCVTLSTKEINDLLSQGTIQNYPPYAPYYPSICFYERIASPPRIASPTTIEKSTPLLDLHASLKLLSI